MSLFHLRHGCARLQPEHLVRVILPIHIEALFTVLRELPEGVLEAFLGPVGHEIPTDGEEILEAIGPDRIFDGLPQSDVLPVHLPSQDFLMASLPLPSLGGEKQAGSHGVSHAPPRTRW